MNDFLWRQVNEEEKNRIKERAKEIMDSFSEALAKVESELTEDFIVKREEQLREESKVACDKNFRKVFFKNAHSKVGEYIKAERGKWK